MSGQRELAVPNSAAQDIRSYAQFMVSSHIIADNAMAAILISTGMTSVDRTPSSGHNHHILQSLGGLLCGS
jgi:hypothetical protein